VAGKANGCGGSVKVETPGESDRPSMAKRPGGAVRVAFDDLEENAVEADADAVAAVAAAAAAAAAADDDDEEEEAKEACDTASVAAVGVATGRLAVGGKAVLKPNAFGAPL
jgi:hypothetical protein